MAGVTGWPFRLLCKEQGCGLVTTEFVSDLAVLQGNSKTRELVRLYPGERPAGIQIFGADPLTMAKAAARIVEWEQPDLIDINMGCPAPKVCKGRGGSGLLREPERAEAVVAAVVRAIHPVPVTVKLRAGWDRNSINAVEIARRVVDAGAAALTVHGRTRDQFYAGAADWEIIDAVARAVPAPVIGNGDVDAAAIAAHRLQTTAVQALAVGRGALGNPWIFAQMAAAVSGRPLPPPPTASERAQMALRHLDLMVAHKGEYIGVREMRKHAAWYLKGQPGAAAARDRINRAETAAVMRAILARFGAAYPATVCFSRSEAAVSDHGDNVC